MARPRRPTALRIVEGNPGHRPLPRDEPKPELGATMPPGLSDAAQAAWPALAAQLTDARILTRLDAVALAALCEVFARWRDAADKVAELGVVMRTSRGGSAKLSPFWVAFMQASSELRRLLTEFGMTPAARARVAAAKDELEDDPFANF